MTAIQFNEFYPLFAFRLLVIPFIFYVNYLLLTPKLLLRKKIVLYTALSFIFLFMVNYGQQSLFDNFNSLKVPEGLEHIKDLPPFRAFKYFVPMVISLTFYLLGGIIRLIVDLYKRDKMVKEKEVQRTETELQFLKTQLNPHFLFNSLNSIYSLVRNRSNDAPEAVITLSELMRYMLYEANQETVPLQKEIEYLKNYVSLQRLRLSNSENVTLIIKGNYDKKKIHPLLLISFIENAFKYGTDFKGNTDIDIKIDVKEDRLNFRVSNIIGPYKVNKHESGIGLSNIKNRLDLLYPNSHTLAIDKARGRYDVGLNLVLT